KLTLDNLRYLLKRAYDKEAIENTNKKMSELRKFYMELHIKNIASGTTGTIIKTGSY
ncbi:9599_t:CDS:1, partial [Diversispora eburnea]